jgi:hypothetical protein
MNMKMLDDIIDPQGVSFDALLSWINERIEAIRKTKFTPEIIDTFTSIELKEDFDHAFGAEGSATWRRFFIATLLADWASYERPVDRADFARLKYIMTSAYRYTRIWGCRLADGRYTPVGYTAWYPVAKFIYDGAINNLAEIDDRGIILPLRYVRPENIRYAYVFNISITAKLINTPCSIKLIRALQREGTNWPSINALAIAVAPEGQKCCQLAHFDQAGTITVQGEVETLFVRHVD